MKSLSHVQLFATPWTVAYQVPLSHQLPDVGVVTPATCHLPSQMTGQHQNMETTPSRRGSRGLSDPCWKRGVSSHPAAVCVCVCVCV